MTFDDIKKIFLSPTMFRLDTILSPRLVPVLYASGLAGLLLLAITHLFASFGRTFGDGLWSILEIVVYGLFGLVVLRLLCEFLLVFFKVNETATKTVSLSLVSASLLDDVRDAISDIAEDATDPDLDATDETPPPATTKRPAARRTAKRTPTAK